MLRDSGLGDRQFSNDICHDRLRIAGKNLHDSESRGVSEGCEDFDKPFGLWAEFNRFHLHHHRKYTIAYLKCQATISFLLVETAKK